jgi:hypothetical protein
VQLFNVGLNLGVFLLRTAATKNVLGALKEVLLPGLNLSGVNLELVGKLSGGAISTDRR